MFNMKKRERRKTKLRDKLFWGSSMVITSLMIILVGAASFAVINYINTMEEEKAFERLDEEADRMADTIETNARNDREILETLAAVIATYDDMYSEELWELLDSCSEVGMMTKLELLLPDNTVLGRGGKVIATEEETSFEDEAAKGAYISNQETDLEDSEKYIVRHCVPVYKDSQAVAILRGIMSFPDLNKEVNLNPYGGKAAVYIIDGSSGDYLLDTWHPEQGGNMWTMGSRQMAPGYNDDELKQGVVNGDSRYVVFVSRTIGEYLYFYYKPMEINEWRIAVSVPESIVFSSANKVRTVLNIFLIIETICFIGYFLWMVRFVRRRTKEKQRQIETLNYIYDIEKILFNAHAKQENITAALEKVGNIIKAEWVGLWALEPSVEYILFSWKKYASLEGNTDSGENSSSYRKDDRHYLRMMREYFEQGHSELEIFEEETFYQIFGKTIPLELRSMIAVPLEDKDGNICGIIAGVNLTGKTVPTALLKNMKFSFSMFCHNLTSYNTIREQRDRDVLTGLYNRNRYERDLEKLYSEYRDALTCVYIDVNGLHEKNNTEGHEKGDIMLRTVAQEIQTWFGGEYIYRIGGDEFVVFIPGADIAEMETAGKKLSEALLEKSYHVSVGIQCEKDAASMDALIKAAEKKMYAEKKQFYEQKAYDRRKTTIMSE